MRKDVNRKMQKNFCGLCGKEHNDNTLSETHWCGNFVIEGVRAEVEISFSDELCFECRTKFENKFKPIKLEHWVPTL